MAGNRDEGHFVTVGRVVAFVAMLLALVLARPFLGGMESAFQTIQEYTGFIAPGVVIIFLLGFFDRRANEASAYAVLVGSVVASLVLKMSMPDLPFVLRIWLVFLLNVAFGVVVSRLTRAPEEGQPVVLGDIRFGTSQGFNVASIAISLILVLIYAAFW
jgi:SSS family solute:Na+ symporter